MVKIAKFGTKPVSYKPTKYDETLKQFKLTNEEFSKLKAGSITPEEGFLKLKAKSVTPEVDAYVKGALDSIKVGGALEEIPPILAKKPPLWKLVIGKIFG